ncbi:MAG: hypothetical protein ACXW4P_06915 [Thermoanaerobaculia bacterium]
MHPAAAAVIALVASFLGVNELIVLFGTGVLIALVLTRRSMFNSAWLVAAGAIMGLLVA